ncbi:MAG: S9 family peptidase [Tannerella sp.]|jgi:dipeptidyl aminopeptidase/acylaminoacyl peptidase|nr:S9 family peptidase [Tannerella sp.]
MNRIQLITALALSFAIAAHADDLKEKYSRADDFAKKYGDLYYNGVQTVENIEDTHLFWYQTNTPDGKRYMLLDADKKEKRPAFDHQRFADSLSAYLKDTVVDAGKLNLFRPRFDKELKRLSFNEKEKRLVLNLNDYSIREEQRGGFPFRGEGYWGSVFKENSKEPVKAPDGKKEAYISEGNVWVRDLKTKEIRQLSFDGSPFEYYGSRIVWSPDSKYLVSCKYRPVDTRQLYLIDSSPDDQLQPRTNNIDYVKPGDALPIRRPVVFNSETGKGFAAEVKDVENQFELSHIEWYDSTQFTFAFNKRGHQEYVIYRTEAATGKTYPVVDETSNTFIYYNMLYHFFLKEAGEMLWISERDGWRHLYLYDFKTGSVKRQLTKGEWVVKSVAHVDEKNRTLIFKACGRDKGEDPYLEKYYSLQIDNGKITPLTPENATHLVTFSKDFSVMVDNYSRVDLPPITVLRSVSDGKVLFQVEKADISKAVEAGWRMPEVFTAKGRDGKTDIWGMIIRPTDFDPSKKYPIVEYIYSGPHDSHVPKSFLTSYRCSGLAEVGFITVLIDGMGTANRSKAFHDVCWQNLKDAGLPDHIAWLKAAAKKYPYMDIDRVGIYGGSAGGQNSMGAVLFHPDFYKVAVSSCGCHDNRMDKIWWNEQWMGYPIGKHYEESSNVCNAYRLQGKLMLILGELDDNVDPSSTLQVVDELIKHKKEFEFVMLPGVKHTLGETYGERKRRDFFVRHLLELTPPEWNE